MRVDASPVGCGDPALARAQRQPLPAQASAPTRRALESLMVDGETSTACAVPAAVEIAIARVAGRRQEPPIWREEPQPSMPFEAARAAADRDIGLGSPRHGG